MDLYSEPEARVAEQEVEVYASPSRQAALRGRIEATSAFWVLGPAEGPGCAEGWGRLEADGYACLDGTSLTEDLPSPRPVLLQADVPEPGEYDHYRQTGVYDAQEPEALLPALWGRRWRRFRGELYADLEQARAGSRPSGRVRREPEPFVGLSADGQWLLREDGQVARASSVYLSPASRLQGRDLRREPLPAGTWPALAVGYDGVAVRSGPDPHAPVVGFWPHHTWLLVRSSPATSDGRWWEVPELGYVREGPRGVRHPLPMGEPPRGVGDEDLWVEISREQQVLCVYRGRELVYFTAVSTSPALRSVRGARVLSKESLDGALPWSLSLGPGCALHGAWWHWGFGHRAGTGCVHLAPKDAAWLFGALSPALPAGWSAINALPDEGTPVRIR